MERVTSGQHIRYLLKGIAHLIARHFDCILWIAHLIAHHFDRNPFPATCTNGWTAIRDSCFKRFGAFRHYIEYQKEDGHYDTGDGLKGDEWYEKNYGLDYKDWLKKNALDFDDAKEACEVCTLWNEY